VPALLAVALGSFLTLGLLVENSPRVRGWDLTVTQSVAQDTTPVVTTLARALTHLADWNVYMAISALAVGALLALRRVRLAGFLLTVVVGQWLLSDAAKQLVARDRPDLDQLVNASGYSFPSGHASAAAAGYLALALVVAALWPRWNLRLLVAGAIAVAIVVAATRVLLGVHWTTDVLAGLAFGWAWCLFCAWVFGVRSTPHAALTEEAPVPT
jgi:undecaprenyl-diphosphatase